MVNRLLFPYLFSAVELMDSQGLEAQAVDACMHLGAHHPMGPLALLDLVGLDISVAIADTIGIEFPRACAKWLRTGSWAGSPERVSTRTAEILLAGGDVPDDIGFADALGAGQLRDGLPRKGRVR